MTRQDFIKFLKEFKTDFINNKDDWENSTLESFLDGMIAYSSDIQGFYNNMKMNVNADKVTWENFKIILEGASVYE